MEKEQNSKTEENINKKTKSSEASENNKGSSEASENNKESKEEKTQIFDLPVHGWLSVGLDTLIPIAARLPFFAEIHDVPSAPEPSNLSM